jgi:hypothetical protein
MSKLPQSGEYVAFSCGKLAAPILESPKARLFWILESDGIRNEPH